MNYFIDLDMDIVEWVLFMLSLLLFILWTNLLVNQQASILVSLLG